MPKPVTDAVLARVRKLLALAADKGTTEEERRTAAAAAARLMQEHGIEIGATSSSGEASAPPQGEPAVTIRGVELRDVLTSARKGLDDVGQALGLDLFGMIREGISGAVRDAFVPKAAPAPARRPKKRPAKRR